MSPPHRLRHLSSPTLSKDELFNDLQMNHSGRMVRGARALPLFEKQKGKLCHPTEDARRRLELRGEREGCSKPPYLLQRGGEERRGEGGASEDAGAVSERGHLTMNLPRNSVHTLFIVVF